MKVKYIKNIKLKNKQIIFLLDSLKNYGLCALRTSTNEEEKVGQVANFLLDNRKKGGQRIPVKLIAVQRDSEGGYTNIYVPAMVALRD